MRKTYLQQQNELALFHLKQILGYSLSPSDPPLIVLVSTVLVDEDGNLDIGPYREPDEEDWNEWLAFCLDAPEQLLEPVLTAMKRNGEHLPTDSKAVREWAGRIVAGTMIIRHFD